MQKYPSVHTCSHYYDIPIMHHVGCHIYIHICIYIYTHTHIQSAQTTLGQAAAGRFQANKPMEDYGKCDPYNLGANNAFLM